MSLLSSTEKTRKRRSIFTPLFAKSSVARYELKNPPTPSYNTRTNNKSLKSAASATKQQRSKLRRSYRDLQPSINKNMMQSPTQQTDHGDMEDMIFISNNALRAMKIEVDGGLAYPTSLYYLAQTLSHSALFLYEYSHPSNEGSIGTDEDDNNSNYNDNETDGSLNNSRHNVVVPYLSEEEQMIHEQRKEQELKRVLKNMQSKVGSLETNVRDWEQAMDRLRTDAKFVFPQDHIDEQSLVEGATTSSIASNDSDYRNGKREHKLNHYGEFVEEKLQSSKAKLVAFSSSLMNQNENRLILKKKRSNTNTRTKQQPFRKSISSKPVKQSSLCILYRRYRNRLQDKFGGSSSGDGVSEYMKKIKEVTTNSHLGKNIWKARSPWIQMINTHIEPSLKHKRNETETGEEELYDDEKKTKNGSMNEVALESLSLHDRMDQLQQMRIEKAEAKARAEKERIERDIREREAEEEARRNASALLRPLSDEEDGIVQEALYGSGPGEEIVARFGADTVQRRSMQCLQPRSWLNDEVIHHFYVMLANRDEAFSNTDPSRKRSHFFKSFFLTKLFDEGATNQYRYGNVKRWSKKVPGKDIFALDKIFCPVNLNNMHWACAVVFVQEKRIQFYDSMTGDGMFHMQGLMNYLKDEWRAKKGGEMPDAADWKLVSCTSDTPVQKNGFDCGVFTCMFADFLSMGKPLTFNQQHITQCRERIALSIMKGIAIE